MLLIISGSSRENGNTEFLAKEAAKAYDGEVEWIHLRNQSILQIVDERHTANGFTSVEDDHRDLIKKMVKADSILFATPVYWYGMSGYMKTFVDRWSQALRDPELNFKEEMKNKPAYVITCGGDKVNLKALPLIQQFQLIFEFMGMDFKNYFIGEARKPGDMAKEAVQLNQMAHFFKK
ncbi:flavodoxin family protein [Jeotgalibacillus sp. S-D1]|uniref:flavodoxin family protein n=1 Tax=Jeotgalibacillus sp. S-D1 TaxID=2552189 RepID=UPI0010594E81|nr:flavodoxin family protein [Jeotgalibacillus sp. S-D1]TDL35438.1 flavodoxin family protein [Jeotgalibacillus sp. S-D1]